MNSLLNINQSAGIAVRPVRGSFVDSVPVSVLTPNRVRGMAHYLSSIKLKNKCPECGARVLTTYLYCPECHYRFRINCSSCSKVLETKWRVCPYCGTDIPKLNKQNITNHKQKE